MKIEAVTVCIDFADKLKKIVVNNHKLDNWVIATHESDKETIKVCENNDINYILSERVFDNAQFAKGRAINDALKVLDKNDWLLHIDADQLLPFNFREVCENECKDKSKMYKCDRVTTHGKTMEYGHRSSARIEMSSNRKMKFRPSRNKIPIGFFQLWHSSVRCVYDEESTTGDKDDISFSAKWFDVKNGTLIQNFQKLSFKTIDVSGFQGHYEGHYVGLRNLKGSKFQ